MGGWRITCVILFPLWQDGKKIQREVEQDKVLRALYRLCWLTLVQGQALLFYEDRLVLSAKSAVITLHKTFTHPQLGYTPCS